MSAYSPIAIAPDEQFVVGESDLASCDEAAYRCGCASILFCTGGSAEVNIDGFRIQFQRNMVLLALAGWMLRVSNRSSDFRIAFCSFSRDLFTEAAFRFDPSFFHALHECPAFYPHEQTLGGVRLWFELADLTYRDRQNIFRNTIMRNWLQNALLEISDTIQRSGTGADWGMESSSRQVELFHKFIALVHENSLREREVAFYADALCISTRYLSSIVRSVSGSSAKELIDRSVVLEIKMMLQSTDLSVQEIAYRLHFPDQSYLGRYFKKHTGQSPTEYRGTKK